MLWAQKIFIYDTKKDNWKQVIEEYGPGVEASLRTFASTLKSVKTAELKNVKDRPVNYKTWMKKVTSKV